MGRTKTKTEREARNDVVDQLVREAMMSPSGIFASLEHARATNDFRAAANAQDRLRLRGVVVSYIDPSDN